MNWYNNLKIRNKFLLFVGMIIFIIIALSGVGLWGTLKVHGIVDGLNDDQIPEMVNMSRASSALQAAYANIHLALLEKDPAEIEKAIANTRENMAVVEHNLLIYINTSHPADEADVVRTLQRELTTWLATMEKMTQLASTNNTLAEEEALDLIHQSNYIDLVDNLEEIIGINTEEAQTYNAESGDTYFLVLVSFIVLSIFVVVVILVLAFVMARTLTGRIQKLQNKMDDLATGNLTQPFENLYQDEIGELSQTYNTTVYSLKMLVQRIQSQSQQVNQATHELIRQSQSQVTGSNQQASAIFEITEALQELNGTANIIAQQATEVNRAMDNTLQQAQLVVKTAETMAQSQETGRANVAQIIETIFRLKDQVGAIEERQRELKEQSSTIGQIIEFIDNISRETHLLALNASIEAAGAGQYGDRFSVIAGEVKRLANSSVEATKEVRQTLEGIAQAIERSNQSALEGVEQAQQASQEAAESDKTLVKLSDLSQQVKTAARSILTYIEETSMLATGIGVATKEQQISSQQVLQSMLSIETTTTQNLSSIKQGEIATQQLNSAAYELAQVAGTFKLVAG